MTLPAPSIDPGPETPFSRELGIEVLEWGEGRALIALDLRPALMNRRGMAHGGVIATMADMVLSLAWRGSAPDRTPVGTLNLNVSFVAPGRGRLIGEGRVLRMTGGCAFCDARIVDVNGDLVAIAQGVFRVRPKEFGSPIPLQAN